MAMPVDGCLLCLGPASAVQSRVVQCFGTVVSEADDVTSPKYTVADVLNKHFWFQLQSDRDANAFVCQPCWMKVLDFHQFYQSVLVLYHQTRWQPAAKEERDALAIDQKLEIILNEDVAQSKSSDCSDDDDGTGNNDWYDESFRVNVKQESVDDGVRAVSPQILPVASSRTNNDCSRRDYQYRAASETGDDVDADQLIAKYFTLICDLCDEPLANLTIARNHHQQVHKQRGYLRCRCGQRFVRNASINEHCAFHEDSSSHKCMECCKIFTNAGRLASHRSSKHPTMTGSPSAAAVLSANLSSATAKSPKDKRADDELILRYISMVCSMCDAGKSTFDSFKKLRQHQRKAHGQTGFVECCGKRFRLKSEAVDHCKWHEDPSYFDCNICGRNFAKSISLRDHHIRRHNDNAPFNHQCDQCDKQFRLADQLRSHKRRDHISEDDLKFECFSCHRGFVYQSHLLLHLRSDERPTVMCDVCAKHFKSKQTYKLHYAVEHGTVIKCKCPECGKWLKHANQLKRHMAQHRAVPSNCDQCDHVAPNQKALYMHRRRVHCAASHKCLVCDRMFKRPQSLREHMAMHAGITDLYTCAYCPQTFRSDSNLYKHRREVHGEQFEADRHAAKLAEDVRNTAKAAAAAANPMERTRFY